MYVFLLCLHWTLLIFLRSAAWTITSCICFFFSLYLHWTFHFVMLCCLKDNVMYMSFYYIYTGFYLFSYAMLPGNAHEWRKVTSHWKHNLGQLVAGLVSTRGHVQPLTATHGMLAHTRPTQWLRARQRRSVGKQHHRTQRSTCFPPSWPPSKHVQVLHHQETKGITRAINALTSAAR